MIRKTSQLNQFGTDFGVDISSPSAEETSSTLIVVQKIVEVYNTFLNKHIQQFGQVEDLRANWRKEIIDTVGEDNWYQLSELSKRTKQIKLDCESGNLTSDDLAKLNSIKEEINNKEQALIQKIDFQSSTIQDLYHSFIEKLEQLSLSPEPTSNRLTLIPREQVPLVINKYPLSSDWKIFTPPYRTGGWYYNWNQSGGSSPKLVNYLDVNSGCIGHRSEYKNYDAEEFEGLFLKFHTRLGVKMWVSDGGRVEVLIKARCASCYYHAWVQDERGRSHSSTRMNSYLTVNVSPTYDDEDRTLVWKHKIPTPPWRKTRTYSDNKIAPNSIQWYRLITEQPVPNNAWSTIWIGTYDEHINAADDVSIESTMRNRWFIEEIYVHVIA